jgi:hypothetical protein
MADALAAAVERLRARVAEHIEQPLSEPAPPLEADEDAEADGDLEPDEDLEPLELDDEEPSEPLAVPTVAPRPAHKHSMSLIRRSRLALARRRERRALAKASKD